MNDGGVFDVIVVGGGPAGCATALSICGHTEKKSILLLDDANPSTFKIGESLPSESLQILQRLHPELSERLVKATASGTHLVCTGNVSSWASAELEERHAILNPFGHGLHLNRATFDESLRQCIVETTNSTAPNRLGLMKGRFKKVEKKSYYGDLDWVWSIHAEVNGETIVLRAKWIIDATGRKASLATKLGARTVTSDPLLAFYAVFTGPSPLDQPEVDNDHRTFIEATPEGWFYSALLSRQPCTRIVAFHTVPTHSSAKLARRRDGFLDLLHSSAPHTSAIILGNDYEISGDGFPGCTAAGSSYLDKACDFENRWIAVGDSAMAFDPLSSQGMMTALEMGYYVGATLASQLDGADADERLEEGIIELYEGVKKAYVGQRAYYYGIVKRFEGQDFWNKII